MYKLTVVAGPNRGASYGIQDGENSIGRQSGNVIVLPSSKVSKRHCVLVASNGELLVKDQGSSNGTFVNGALTKSRKVKPGDRISVGEFVLAVSEMKEGNFPSSNVLQFPMPVSSQSPAQPSTLPGMGAPKDLKSKAIWFFENKVMPVFYNFNLKHEWRILGIVMFAAFVIGNLILTVYPMLENNRANIIREIGKRADFMAKQIADRNASYLAASAETRTNLGSIPTADGVQLALLTDLDNRIIAPSDKMNQYLTSGGEATFAIQARNLFRAGRETGLIKEIDSSTLAAIEPVKVLNPSLGKNVVVAMAIVSMDTSLATPDLGEIGMSYSETLILTGLLGALILLILYRVTLKPFQVLNDDMDKVLKGELPQVTHEFKFQELSPLWDLINSALQRVPKSGTKSGIAAGAESIISIEEFTGPLGMLGKVANYGLVVCDADRKIVSLNNVFEELSGIRAEGAIGQDLSSVARDQSLGVFVNDIFDRAPVGDEGIFEDYEFSGISYKVHAAAFGTTGSMPRCFVLAIVRNPDG